MKTLVEFIKEQLQINEGVFTSFYKSKNDKWNFNLFSRGHAGERSTERMVKTSEIIELFKDCYSRIKKYIELGIIKVNKYGTKTHGSAFALHSSDKSQTGYLTIICYPVKFKKEKQIWDFEIVTMWKGKKMDSFMEKDPKTGKTMNRPEFGTIDIWDNQAINHYDKKDAI